MSNIFDVLKNNISNTTLITYLQILIAAITTYFVTKYTSTKPARLSIGQQQFEKVYLPLYKLLCTSPKSDISKEDTLKYAIRIKSILFKNYELAFPQLHDLLNDLFKAINKNSDYQIIFNKITYQVSLDYEILKKKLGYPSESAFNIFMRKTMKDKLSTILGYITLFYIIPGIFILGFFANEDTFNKIICIYFVFFILILFINIKVNPPKN
jgi:hypothetical protein